MVRSKIISLPCVNGIYLADNLKRMFEEEERRLSPYAFPSRKATRINDYLRDWPHAVIKSNSIENGTDPYTMPFVIDATMAKLSSVYSRLGGKAMSISSILHPHDLVSNRLTHVGAAAIIGMRLAEALCLNVMLVVAALEIHDVGQPPFGHAGEEAFSSLCKDHDIPYTLREGERQRIVDFSHPAQSFRILAELEEGNMGLNLIVQTLDAALCHNKQDFHQRFTFNPQKTPEMLLQQYHNAYTIKGTMSAPIPMTLEGCVVKVADIISYIGKDPIDGIRIGLITRDDIPEETLDILIKLNKHERLMDLSLDEINRRITNTIINDIIEQSYGQPYIEMSRPIYEAVKKTRTFIYQKINPDRANESRGQIKDIVNKLFEIYLDDIEMNNKKSSIFTTFLNKKHSNYIHFMPPKRIVIDHLVGMTDAYFIEEYKKRTIPRLGRDFIAR